MAGSVNAGNIIYEVDMDTARLLAARREVDAALNGLSGSMGRLDASVTRTERSVASMERAMSSLSGVAKGVIAALSIQQVAQYGNEWVTVNNKLANSVRASEQLADVTQRVFDISQNTMSSLTATATLYGRLERATRSAGTSTKDLVTLTSTINKGLAVSGATTEEASSTMTQLSQALASGVLRGEEFNSISENGSRLAVALADSLGVTIGQLRAMAAQGKLTTEVVVNGLLKQSDTIAKEFANTTMTMGQALTVATNNITKFVGESSSVSTSIKVFNESAIGLSQNLEIVANLIGAAAVIFGGRFAGALALATKSRIDDALAARAQTTATAESAAATANAARVTALKAGLDKDQAVSNLALAQTEYNVAKGTAAEAFALENLIAVKSVAIQRSAAFAEAQLAEAAATRTATAAAAAASTTIGSLARGALALVGGPAGAAVIAAAGIFYFYQKMQQARQESIAFADKLDGVIAKMKSMSQVQLAAEIDNASRSIKAQTDALKDNQSTIEANELQQARLKRTLSYLSEGSLLYKATLSELTDAQSEHTQLLAENERAENKLSQTVSKTGILRAHMNGTFAQGIDLLKRDGEQAGVAAGLMNQFGNAINFASRAKEKFNSTSLEIPRSDKADEYNKGLQEENTLLAITDKRLRAVTKARMDAAEKQGNQNQINAAGELAGRNYDLQQAEVARNKAAKESISAGKKAATQAESIAQKLANLKQQAELSADSTRDLSREQAILAAQQSLGSAATQGDIKLAGEYAASKWDTANAIKAQAAAEKLLPEARENASYQQDISDLKTALTAKKITQQQYNATSEQLEQQHQVNLAKIRAASNSGVTALQDAQGGVDPVQALANENARKLALIQEFETEKGQITANGLALMNAANTEYEQARIDAAWKIWENQSQANQMLGSVIESLQGGATNAITGLLNGTQSLSESFANIGSTILNSVVGSLVQMGVEYLKSSVMASTANTIAAASAAATGASITASMAPAAAATNIATMGSASAVGLTAMSAAIPAMVGLFAGAREHGGPVSASSMYRVGEGGKPEIFKASNGSQYMIPGDNGKVISNSDLGDGGSSGGMIQQVNHFTFQNASGDQQQMVTTFAKIAYEQSLRAIKDQKRPGGMLTK